MSPADVSGRTRHIYDGRPVFLIPALNDRTGLVPDLTTGIDTASPPWLDGVTGTTLELLLTQLSPLLRALTIAGYDGTEIYYGVSGGDGAPDRWLHVPLATNVITEVSELDESVSAFLAASWPELGAVAMIIKVEPRYRDEWNMLSMGLALEAPSGAAWLRTFDSDIAGYLLVWAESYPEDPAKPFETLSPGFEQVIDLVVQVAAAEWQTGAVEGERSLGLLWLLNPDTWRRNVPIDEFVPSTGYDGAAVIAARALQAPGSAKLPVPDFLRDQIFARRGLTDVVRYAGGINSLFPAGQTDQFFKDVDAWIAEVGATPGELPDELREMLPPLSWLDVVLILTEALVIAPEELMGPGLPIVIDEGEPEEKVAVVRVDDETLCISVLGSDDIEIHRAIPLDGYTFEESVAWHYESKNDAGKPSLTIIAVPGIEITALEPQPAVWDLELIRAQDPGVIPPWGTPIYKRLLQAKYPIAYADLLGDDEAALAEADATPRVEVSPTSSGVQLAYPLNPDGSMGEPPLRVDISLTDPNSAAQRFAFDVQFVTFTINETPVIHDAPRPDHFELRPVVTIWTTPGVYIAVQQREGVEVVCWQVEDVTKVPPHGETLPIWTGGWSWDVKGLAVAPAVLFPPLLVDGETEAEAQELIAAATGFRPVRREPDSSEPDPRAWARFTFVCDILIGFVPVVGDVADVAELGYSVYSGTDKWGEPVTRLDQFLMAGGILLPFVGSGFLKGVGRAID